MSHITKCVFLCVVAWFMQAATSSIPDDCQCEDIKVTLTSSSVLKNKGFHKDLVTTIVGKWKGNLSSSLPASCRILIVFNLPSSAFIDPYQVDSKVHETFEVLIPQDVDIEMPAEKALPLRVWWFVPIPQPLRIINLTLSLPVNIRYHQANAEGSISFDIPPPSAFKRDCSSETDKTLVAACNVKNSSACTWVEQPLSSKDYMHVTVPVGLEHHTPVVVAITVMASVLGTLLLSCVVVRVNTHKVKAA